MTLESNKSVEKFISACDDLITCKFLVAETKIQKILGLLAETPPVYELVSACMEQFNRDREMSKAFVQESRGNFVCIMPQEEFKIIALVFCALADINAGRINFMEFVKTFFNDEEGVTCFKRFIGVMIIPFRNLIADAFGYPRIELDNPAETTLKGTANPQPQQKPVEQKEPQYHVSMEVESRLVRFPSVRNTENAEAELGEALAKVCEVCQKITGQILEELESFNKRDYRIDELKSICYSIIMATSDHDFDMLRGLTIGLKYASKGVRSIKFLVRELDENVDDFLRILTDLKH